MGKLGDLWVRLGLKSDDYKKGIDKAKKETKGFGSTLANMKAGALAVWAVIGASVTKFAKDFINHSQTIGDMWAQVTGKMQTVWSQFLTALTNWDWEGFGSRVRNAMDAASESILAHDAEFEVMNSIKMRKAAMAEELAQLQIIMRDTRRSYDDRAKAAQEYLDKVRPLYEEEIKLRKRQYMTDTAEYLASAGVEVAADNRDLLRKFFTDIAPDEKLMGQLIENSKKNTGKKYNLSKADLADLDKFYEQYGTKAAATLNTIASYYQSTNDDVANKVISAIMAYDQSLAAMNEETRRIQNVRNSALTMSEGGGSGEEWSVDSLDRVKSAHEIAFKTGQQIAEDLRTLQDEFSEIEDLDIDMSGVEAEMDAFLLKFKDETMRKKIGLEVEWIGGDMPDIAMGGDADISKAIITLPKMDTSSLKAGIAEIRNIIGEYESLLQNIESGHIELPPADLANLKQSLLDLQGIEENFQHRLDVIAEMNAMLEDAIVSSITNGIQAITDAMFSIEGADWKSVLAAFIAPLGDTLKQMGAMIMAEGVAMEAFKKSFTNPAAAIAAGAALMAIGSMVSSGLQRLISGTGNGGGSAMSYGSSSSGGAAALNYESTLTVEVTGRISGNDIVLSGKKTNDKNSR